MFLKESAPAPLHRQSPLDSAHQIGFYPLRARRAIAGVDFIVRAGGKSGLQKSKILANGQASVRKSGRRKVQQKINRSRLSQIERK